jgi:hypothetical protein
MNDEEIPSMSREVKSREQDPLRRESGAGGHRLEGPCWCGGVQWLGATRGRPPSNLGTYHGPRLLETMSK